MMAWAWAAASALAIWAPMWSARGTAIPRSERASSIARVRPSRYSMMKKCSPLSVWPKSWISTMCSLPIWLTARASLRNRLTTSLLPASSRWMTLRATFLPMWGCSARNTIPIPPTPTRERIR